MSFDDWIVKELKHSKNFEPWGKRIINCIDQDNCVDLRISYEALAPKGANINEQINYNGYGGYIWTPVIHNYLGDTSLHLSLRQKKMKCFNMLLYLKADYKIPNNSGITAEDLCNEILGKDIKILSFESLKYLISNSTPSEIDFLSSDAAYRGLKREAMDLLLGGRMLYTEIPKSFNYIDENKKKKSERNRPFHLSFILKEKELEKLAKEIDESNSSNAKRGTWVELYDENGYQYYYNEVFYFIFFINSILTIFSLQIIIGNG